jgi:hypothetical protein
MEIGPQRGGGKEARNHGVEPRGHGDALTGKIGADHAEVAAQFGQVPAFAAKDAHVHLRPHHGVELAGDGQDERGFAAAVGTENGHVLARADAEMDVVQHHPLAARHVHPAQLKEIGMRRGGAGEWPRILRGGFGCRRQGRTTAARAAHEFQINPEQNAAAQTHLLH